MFVAPVESSASLSVLALSIVDVSPTHSHRITAVDGRGGGTTERRPSLRSRIAALLASLHLRPAIDSAR